MLTLLSLYMEPTLPVDPAQTKRSHGEPAVEKARFSSLLSVTDTRRTPLQAAHWWEAMDPAHRGVTPLEPRVLHRNHSCSEVHTPNLPVPERENKGAGSR